MTASRPALARANAGRAEWPRHAAAGAVLGATLGLALLALSLNDLVGMPGGNVILPAAVLGALLGLTPFRNALWVLAGAAVLVLIVVGSTPIIRPAATALVREDPLGPRPVDAIVALSGGKTEEGLIGNQGVERLLSALVLVHRRVAPVLVVTIIHARHDPKDVSSEADQRRLAALLGDSVHLEAVDSVFTTHDEALGVARLARARGWRGVAVVTSPVHSSRACATFERVGLTVTCLPAESRELSLSTLRSARERMRAFGLVLYEWAAWLKYKVRRWV